MPVTNINFIPIPQRVVGPTGPTGPSGGLTVGVITAKVTSSGSTGGMTFTNGLLTAQTQAT